MSAGADIAILVPVKELSHSKTRLSPLLSGEERRRLAWVLLERVLREVARAQRHCRRVVVSNYAPAIELAEASGFEVIREARQISESDSVDAASTLLERQGVRGVLRVPLDLPLFCGEALQPLLEEAAGLPDAPGVVDPLPDCSKNGAGRPEQAEDARDTRDGSCPDDALDGLADGLRGDGYYLGDLHRQLGTVGLWSQDIAQDRDDSQKQGEKRE